MASQFPQAFRTESISFVSSNSPSTTHGPGESRSSTSPARRSQSPVVAVAPQPHWWRFREHSQKLTLDTPPTSTLASPLTLFQALRSGRVKKYAPREQPFYRDVERDIWGKGYRELTRSMVCNGSLYIDFFDIRTYHEYFDYQLENKKSVYSKSYVVL